MWSYALLEVYAPEGVDTWPEGTPADWIERGDVSYCNGEARGYVQMAIPLRTLLWWLVADIPARIQRWLERSMEEER